MGETAQTCADTSLPPPIHPTWAGLYVFFPAEYWFETDAIKVKVSVNLYEGNSCQTTDYEDRADHWTILYPDQRQDMTISVPGDGGGSATLRLSLNYEKNA